MKISFSAFEYHTDEVFHKADYRYEGSCENGWQIFRNESHFKSLGSGYVLLKSLYCGICSTDIARAKLPFPLPQITGHEVIALYHDKPVAVEINASHLARGIENHDCYYCQQAMGEHCPDRLTLGIDRLPGGFSPYILAPQKSIFPLPDNIDSAVAAVIEPFAAALHAVESMKITNGMQVAIVGPRRLGLLLILALKIYRENHHINFTLFAIIRHSELIEKCLEFGADDVILTDDLGCRQFDLVYDTTGSISGFALSVQIAKKRIHLKSTHGLSVDGFSGITQFVIDELTLHSLRDNKLDVLRATLRKNSRKTILLDVTTPHEIHSWLNEFFPNCVLVECDLDRISDDELEKLLPSDGFKKFDVAIVSSLTQLNLVVGSVRAKGDLFFLGDVRDENSIWCEFFERQLTLCSSRCGSFTQAIKLIEENSTLFSKHIKSYISGQYEMKQLNEIFEKAKQDVKSIKLIMKH